MNQIPKLGPGLWWHIVVLVLTIMLFLATYSMPMLATPGFESANLFAIILGPLLALAATLNKDGPTFGFSKLLTKELAWGAAHLALFFSLLFANSFFITSCSIGAGIGTFFIILIPPLILNISAGTVLACLIPKLALRLLIFVLAYGAYAGWVAYYWWQDSPFRLMTHFSLLLSTDLAEGGELTPAIMAFRLASLCLGLALITLGLAFLAKTGRRLNSPAKKPGLYLVACLAFLASAWLLHAYSLQSTGKNKAELIHDYSLSASKNNISVRANPDFTSQAQVNAILQEALLYQQRLGERLGGISQKPITIWLHDNDEQKFIYTGAQHVHFAQPKHREIHISGTNIPHGVLGHELAHIYIGEYATTFFGLPGQWGIVPNMALTEGLAMLLTPELTIDNNLDIVEQAQAIHQAGFRIDIMQLFSMNPLDFLRSHFRASYIFAGAFLKFYLDQMPQEKASQVLQKIIRDGSLAGMFATKDELFEALAKFSALLAEPVDNYALLWAKRNFSASGVLTSDCGKSNKEAKLEFWRFIRNEDVSKATAILTSLPPDEHIKLVFAAIKFLMNQHQCLQALEIAKHADALLVNAQDGRIEELRLNQVACLVEQNRLSEASEVLNALDPSFLDLSSRRQAIIQADLIAELGLSQDPSFEQLLQKTQNLFTSGLDIDQKNFAYALGKYVGPPQRFAQEAKYLYARMLMRGKKYDAALPILQSILNGGFLPEAIVHESEVMKAECQDKLKLYDQAEQTYRQVLSKPLRPSKRIEYLDALQRINFLRAE